MSRYDDWRSGRGDWRQNPWDDRSDRQYQDDVRWGGVTYGSRDTDHIWQGDDPRDRDYGMVGSWREGRHEARWRDDRWQDDRWNWENQDRGQNMNLHQWNPLRATHLDTRGYDPRGFDLRGRGQDDRWGYDQRRDWDNDQRRFLDNDQRRYWDKERRQGPFTGKGPRGYQRNWERVRESVCDALERDSFVDATNIDVRLENGEVTLTGTVADRHQKRIAERIVEHVDGVRDVHNQLRIDRTLGANGRDTISQAPYNTQASGRSAST